LRDLVRRDKADAVHILDDLVRVFFNPRKAEFAVNFKELIRLINSDPIRFQREQNIPHHAVFGIACEDHIAPFCANTGYFRKA